MEGSSGVSREHGIKVSKTHGWIRLHKDFASREACRYIRLTFDVNPRAAFQARDHGAAWPLPRLKMYSAGVTCNGHDAAPVLFGRAASAAGPVRRLAGLNAKLAGGDNGVVLGNDMCEESRMQYGFDTSALNRLYDDSDRDALITAFLATGRVWISAYNVIEAAKTTTEERRHGLVRMMRRLSDGKPPLGRPNMIVRSVAGAYAAGAGKDDSMFNPTDDPEVEGLWTALKEPELIDEELRDEASTWAQAWERDYDAIAAGARARFQSVFDQSPKDRPPSAAGTIRAFMRNDDQIYSALVAPIYEQATGHALTRELYDEMMKEPVWPLYLGGYGYAVHHRSIKRDGYSKGRNAGGIDLGQAVYLRLIDRYITNDNAQFRALRFLATFAHAADYPVEVLTYNAFRHRLVPFG